MLAKLFNVINFTLCLFLPLFSLNIIVSKYNPNDFFPLIFICLGFCDVLLGINLLNANKKFLSASTFILASFIFILVGSKVFIYN